jgi:hypothetical protein
MMAVGPIYPGPRAGYSKMCNDDPTGARGTIGSGASLHSGGPKPSLLGLIALWQAGSRCWCITAVQGRSTLRNGELHSA